MATYTSSIILNQLTVGDINTSPDSMLVGYDATNTTINIPVIIAPSLAEKTVSITSSVVKVTPAGKSEITLVTPDDYTIAYSNNTVTVTILNASIGAIATLFDANIEVTFDIA